MSEERRPRLPPGPPADTLRSIVFERLLLRTVALHLLGCTADAETAVRRTYVRWYTMNDEQQGQIDNKIAWLVRTVARTCLDVLGVPPDGTGTAPSDSSGTDTRGHVEDRVDPVGLALLVVFESMTAAEWVDLVVQSQLTQPSSGYPCASGPATKCGRLAGCPDRQGPPGTARPTP
ncbi:hypothetical protein [Micromonospora sp. NPDC023737]|uniref:hypothetical protein n=1 Tax=unclassified Micromonospora TaxID=2617518 RepID=UPI0033C3719E